MAQHIGHIVFAGVDEDGKRSKKTATEYPETRIEQALGAAGMPAELQRELRPKFAFVRGMKQLAKDGLIQADLRDKAQDDDTAVRFSFLHRANNGERYTTECLVEFNKITEELYVVKAPEGVSERDVKARARQLIDAARTTWTASDVNQLVARYVHRYCRRVGLRAGVYFVPISAEHVVKALGEFYSSLGVQYLDFPVGHGTRNASAVHTAVVNDMRAEIRRLMKEVKELQTDGKLTERVGRNRLEELRAMLDQYRDLARSTQTTMQELIEEAGGGAEALVQAAMPVDALLAKARGGEKVAPIVVDLLAASGGEGGAELAELRTLVAAQPMADVGSEIVPDMEPVQQALQFPQ